jgi:hypothetical protein
MWLTCSIAAEEIFYLMNIHPSPSLVLARNDHECLSKKAVFIEYLKMVRYKLLKMTVSLEVLRNTHRLMRL